MLLIYYIIDYFLYSMLSKGVYVLELENGNYYVGFSKNIPKRLKLHFSGKGSMWTKLHKPIRVVETIEGSLITELKTTLKYVFVYGSDKVRGSIYVSPEPNETKVHMINCKAKYYVMTGKASFKWIDINAIKYCIK